MTIEKVKPWVRPVTSAIAALATCGALFSPAATSDKMMVTAALAGSYVIARMKEKIAGKA